MGCCSSTATTAAKDRDDEVQAVLTRGGGTVHGSAAKKSTNAKQSHTVREPTLSEKRRKVAEAAETRQGDWRQGGAADPEKAKALRMRREKDELLGKIENRYKVLGKEAPIGLPSCDLDQLKRHFESLK